jgi:branched-chain amino acid aminotransferase
MLLTKHCPYTPNITARIEIADTDATVPTRLDDDGYVTEAAANVFVISDGTVSTPDDQQILSGTTRAAMVEILKTDGRWDMSTSDLTPYDLYTADECFLTGSIAGVRSITYLNGDPIGLGDIGSDTRATNEMPADHLIEAGTPIR